MSRRTVWPAAALGTAVLGFGLDRAGLPSSYLFAALLVGLTIALARPGAIDVPGWMFTAAQAVTGVVLGAYLQSSSIKALGGDWLPVVLVSAATLIVCLAAGAALARWTSVDAPTGALGMVAGGASGIVAMADELGADDRLVAFMQYLRVLVVVMLTPLLVAVFFPGAGGAGGVPSGGAVFGTANGWLLTLGIATVGAALAARVRMTAGALMGPLILGGALTLAFPHLGLTVPPVLRETAFAVIGLQVGLRFTVATVKQAGKLLLPVLGAIVALLVACFGLAEILHLTGDVTLRDAYLATTPGGLYAVLAVAFGAGANTTFVIAVQGLRLLVMILLAPVCVRVLLRTRV